MLTPAAPPGVRAARLPPYLRARPPACLPARPPASTGCGGGSRAAAGSLCAARSFCRPAAPSALGPSHSCMEYLRAPLLRAVARGIALRPRSLGLSKVVRLSRGTLRFAGLARSPLNEAAQSPRTAVTARAPDSKFLSCSPSSTPVSFSGHLA